MPESTLELYEYKLAQLRFQSGCNSFKACSVTIYRSEELTKKSEILQSTEGFLAIFTFFKLGEQLENAASYN